MGYQTEMNNRLGEFVKKRREIMELSQRELARRTKLSNTAINRLEKGIVQPEIETLRVIAKTLAVPLTQLVELTQGKPKPLKEPADPLMELVEQLPPNRRKLAEEILKVLVSCKG